MNSPRIVMTSVIEAKDIWQQAGDWMKVVVIGTTRTANAYVVAGLCKLKKPCKPSGKSEIEFILAPGATAAPENFG